MIARQITEAFPWDEPRSYLTRDRDRVYGAAVTHHYGPWASATSRSPQARLAKNGFAERPIGSIRRECVDHVSSWAKPIYAGS